MLYLDDLAEENVQIFITIAKDDGFSEVDIENALSSDIQDLSDTFYHLNLYFDSETYEITAMDNETLTLKKLNFEEILK